MMIASLLSFDRNVVQARQIKDLYGLHKLVYDLFEDVRSADEKNRSQSSGIQWMDMGHRGSIQHIAMLSNRAPDQKRIDQEVCLKSQEIHADFLKFNRYRFKTIVNPTRRDSQSRKLIPVKGEDAIADWFCERSLAAWGFEVDRERMDIRDVTVHSFEKRKQHPDGSVKRHQVTQAHAHIEGILTVTDPVVFAEKFQQGIGRGRSFGCGMLQIVPIVQARSKQSMTQAGMTGDRASA